MKRMGFYDRYILPRLIGCACGAKPIAKQRAKIAPQAEGVVLELGFGSGLNLPFYDPAKVARVIAVEPSLGMISQAEKAIASSPVPVEVRLESAERLSAPDASVDTVAPSQVILGCILGGNNGFIFLQNSFFLLVLEDYRLFIIFPNLIFFNRFGKL